MEWKNHIITDDQVHLGKPIIKDTELTVEHFIRLLAQGRTEQRILEDYPRLTEEALEAVFSYIDYLKDALLYSDASLC